MVLSTASPGLAQGEKGFVFHPNRSLLGAWNKAKVSQLAKLNTKLMTYEVESLSAACPGLAQRDKGFGFHPHRSLLSGENKAKDTELAKLNTKVKAAGDFSRLHI